MKKFRIIGMVLVAIFMGVNFTSCKPDDKKDPTENPAEKPRKRLVYFNVDDKITFLKYDDQGHLIEYSDVIGPYTYTYTYVWGENTIDITIDADGISQEKCTLNLENGLASGISENPYTFTSSFKYNSSNRLIECEYFMGNRKLEWNDDKLIKINKESSISTGSETYAYDKNYTTKGYNPLTPYFVTTEMLYIAHPELAGLATQKLFDSDVSYQILGDNEYTFSYKYEYNFDEDGYVNNIIVRHNEEDCNHIVSDYTFIWE